MAPYDSESSGEDDDFTETNVLLGYASSEPTGDPTSHLGGHPTWLDGQTAPSGTLAKCKVCNDLLTLLLELNGDLPEHFPGHERRLYLFTCRRKTCRRKEGSVRGVRGVRIAKGADTKRIAKTQDASARPVEEEKKPQTNLGESIFGVKSSSVASSGTNPFANPFSPVVGSKAPANPFSSSTNNTSSPPASEPQPPQINEPETDISTLPETFASKARIGASIQPPQTSQPPRPHEPWPSQDRFSPPYPHYHLDADYETLDAPSAPSIPSNARMDIDEPGAASGSGGGKEDQEAFESTLDKTFQKFADRIGQNAEQVLRYEFKGDPLLYSRTDAVGKSLALPSHGDAASSKITTAGAAGGAGFPRCQNCGAVRVFEVQLTPHAITELEVDEMGLEGMEWGTIVLGVCSKDCRPPDVDEGEVGYLEEWVGVQWEELAKR